jgi:tetratricopeptide (TPR) repeat protein
LRAEPDSPRLPGRPVCRTGLASRSGCEHHRRRYVVLGRENCGQRRTIDLCHRASDHCFQAGIPWQAADAELKQAIELEPGNAEAHRLAGYLATTYGRFDEAIEQSEKAIGLDPLQPWNYIARGYAAYRSGRLAQAEADFRTALDLAPGSGKFHCLLGAALIARGERESALAEMKKEPSPRFHHVGMALALGALGRHDESDEELRTAEQEFGDEMGYWIAMVYAARGDPDRAFAWLDRSFNVYGDGMTWIKGDPLLATLVEDPRYKALLQKMRLPE